MPLLAQRLAASWYLRDARNRHASKSAPNRLLFDAVRPFGGWRGWGPLVLVRMKVHESERRTPVAVVAPRAPSRGYRRLGSALLFRRDCDSGHHLCRFDADCNCSSVTSIDRAGASAPMDQRASSFRSTPYFSALRFM